MKNPEHDRVLRLKRKVSAPSSHSSLTGRGDSHDASVYGRLEIHASQASKKGCSKNSLMWAIELQVVEPHKADSSLSHRECHSPPSR